MSRNVWARGNGEYPVWSEKFITYLLFVEFTHVTDDEDGAEVRTGCSEWNDILFYPKLGGFIYIGFVLHAS